MSQQERKIRELGDEHAADPALLQMTLDDCRIELARLRGDRQIIKVCKLDQDSRRRAQMPTRLHQGDAGFDLYVSEYVYIEPQSFVDVHCDVAIELPPNLWAMIVGRSSTLRKRGLLVNQGIIDQGYRGELYAGCWNMSTEGVNLEPGERIAQFIPMPLVAGTVALAEVAQLGSSSRGTDGFGSTGT